MDMTDKIFQIFYKEKKTVNEDVIWNKDGEDGFTTNHVIVYSSTLKNGFVTLKCELNIVNEFSFNIILEKNKTLVRYDNFRHKNYIDKCTGVDLLNPHKHKFKKDCPRELAAKIIPDSEIESNDVNKAFEQFLEECSIIHNGLYLAPDKLRAVKQLQLSDFALKSQNKDLRRVQ